MANNGERLEAKIAGQSIGISSANLLPVLLLLGGIVGGVLIYRGIDTRLVEMRHDHERVLTTIQSQTSKQRQATLLILRGLSTVQYNFSRAKDEQIPLLMELDWDAHKEKVTPLPDR